LSDFYTLLDMEKVPQEDIKTGLKIYSVNGMYGTENSDSISRVYLATQSATTKKLCDAIVSA